MAQLPFPTSFFGLPLAVRRADVEQLVDALTALWHRQMRTQLHAMEEDLAALRVFFDPLATGARLRRLLAQLPPPLAVRSRLLGAPLVLTEADETLVTPEGRVALYVLDSLLKAQDSDTIVIDSDTVFGAEHLVYNTYRGWSVRRLEDVIRLRAGTSRQALRTPSIAMLLLLLVNGSRSRETALPSRLPDRADQARLDSSVGRIIRAFSDALGAGDRDERHFSLYQGYAITEARRRLPEALGPEPDVVYVLPGQEDRVLQLIAAELRRPQRSPAVDSVMAAFDHLVETYRHELPTLASLRVAHERRATTRRQRERLEAALGSNTRRS